MFLQTEIDHYDSPHVRNVIWSLLSPELFKTQNTEYHFPHTICSQIYQEIQPELMVQDLNDEQLGIFLQHNNHHRIGIYFERCWLYLLKHTNNYRILAHNLPINMDGRTLGELDLLVENTDTQEIEHWELTLKFYLQVEYESRIEWLGPNLKDRLSRKFRHLTSRQLTLSDHPRVQRYCESQGWSVNRKRLLSRGRLFYPFRLNSPAEKISPPGYISNGHLTGMWISVSEFKLYFVSLTQCRFLCLQKPEWMAHIKRSPLTFNQISDQLQTQALLHPIQVVVMDWESVPQVLFLVPDEWLDEAQNEINRLK